MLNFHLHVHLLITDGGIDREGAFERFTFFDTQLIERLFRAEVLRLLMDRIRGNNGEGRAARADHSAR